MSLITIILLSVALAMDCLAVSISQSACFKRPHWRKWLFMAVSFGLFQGMMPLMGYYVMQLFSDIITAYDHWLAFIILGFLGARMIKEDLVNDEKDEADECVCRLKYKKILVLAVATSIDALATGVVFLPCPDRLLLGVSCIALVSFVLSLIGTQIGFYIGKRFSFKWGVLGGVILILIGTKILIEHTCF